MAFSTEQTNERMSFAISLRNSIFLEWSLTVCALPFFLDRTGSSADTLDLNATSLTSPNRIQEYHVRLESGITRPSTLDQPGPTSPM